MTKITSIDQLELVPTHSSYYTLLSGLHNLREVRMAGAWFCESYDWNMWKSEHDDYRLGQISGLSSISELEWGRMVGGRDAPALATLLSLTCLKLAACSGASWSPLSRSLAALTALKSVSLCILDKYHDWFVENWDGENDFDPNDISPVALSSLGPLSLPSSVSDLELWFRYMFDHRSYGYSIDLFEGFTSVERLQIAVSVEYLRQGDTCECLDSGPRSVHCRR